MVRLTHIFEQLEEEKNNREFLKTKFTLLDNALDGGFLRKELIILGAGTGIGKSYLAGQWFSTMASQAFNSAYFSLEISNEMVVSRIVGALANLKPTRVMFGLLEAEEYKRKTTAKANITAYEKYMDFFDDVYELSKLLEIIKKNKYEFVVIDFMQNIIDQTQKDEYSRLTKISLELQKAAKEANCTIVCLSQMSNAAVREGGNGKVLEYKGSGSIATVCDLGFFLERGELNTQSLTQDVKLSLRKNRRGTSGISFNLFFKVPGGKIIEAA